MVKIHKNYIYVYIFITKEHRKKYWIKILQSRNWSCLKSLTLSINNYILIVKC